MQGQARGMSRNSQLCIFRSMSSRSAGLDNFVVVVIITTAARMIFTSKNASSNILFGSFPELLLYLEIIKVQIHESDSKEG